MFLPVLSAPTGGGGKRAAPHGLYGIHRPVSAPGQAARRSRSFLIFHLPRTVCKTFFRFAAGVPAVSAAKGTHPFFATGFSALFARFLARSSWPPPTSFFNLRTRDRLYSSQHPGRGPGPLRVRCFCPASRPGKVFCPARLHNAARAACDAPGPPPIAVFCRTARLFPAGPGAALCRVLRRSSARLSLCAGPSFRSTRRTKGGIQS